MGEMIRKYYPVAKVADDPDSFYMTTIDPDLEGDRVLPERMDLSMFIRAGAPILYLHDSYGRTGTQGLPIGSVRAIEMIPGRGIKAHGIDWVKPPRPETVDWVESAWKQRKLRGASVGFLSNQSKPNEFGGRDHLASTLAELSLCVIPANPACYRQSADDRLMVLRALGLDEDGEADKMISIPSVLSVEKTQEFTRPDGSRLIVLADEPEETKEAVMLVETPEPETKDAEVTEEKAVTADVKMPMPSEDMPPEKRPMAECVAKSHEYMKMAAGAMAEGCACAHAAGDDGMATEMSAMGEDMMGMCSQMGQMMKAMREPMDPDDMNEPHKPMMEMDAAGEFITKQGNALNKANRTKLRNAMQAISEVLASARAPEDTPEPETESVPAETMAFDLSQLKGMLDDVLAEVRR